MSFTGLAQSRVSFTGLAKSRVSFTGLAKSRVSFTGLAKSRVSFTGPRSVARELHRAELDVVRFVPDCV